MARYPRSREGSFTRVALAPCAPFNVTRQLMIDTAALADKHDCLLHTHLGETQDEDDYCLHHLGCRPLNYLEQVGWLNPRVGWRTAFTSMLRRLGARPASHGRLPLPYVEHDAVLGRLPEQGSGGRGRHGRSWRRRLRLKR